ncbi:MAG: hydratase [Alphaproteobacteria bacterium]|nr:hydratase [Alphaproteobacteria bacterium]
MTAQTADSELVARLATARRIGEQIQDLPPSLIPSSNAAGYDVATAVEKALGWAPLGWKIAGTTAAVREKLRIDAPIYGRTYRKFKSASPCRLDRSRLLDPLIECEFFVTLAKDLEARAEPWQMDEVAAAIGDVHAGVEVAECRFPSAALPPLPAILADGAASGRYVFGSRIPNWRDGLADIAVILEVDGQPRRHGAGRDVMGDPLAPLHWLAETLRGLGRGLAAGETVSTGSCTGMLPLRDGRHMVAYFGDSARVEIDFDG